MKPVFATCGWNGIGKWRPDFMQPDDTLNIIDLLLVTDLEFRPIPTNGQP
jgi:hypothetical protein